MTNYNLQRLFTQNFSVYYNNAGNLRLLGIATIDYPEVSKKTVDISGTGIMGEISAPVPGMYESMETTIHWRQPSSEYTILNAPITHMLTFRSAQTNYEGANGGIFVEGTKLLLNGLTKSSNLGKLEPASSTENETVLEIVYLKLSVKDEELWEFDKFNYVDKINGVDYAREYREQY